MKGTRRQSSIQFSSISSKSGNFYTKNLIFLAENDRFFSSQKIVSASERAITTDQNQQACPIPTYNTIHIIYHSLVLSFIHSHDSSLNARTVLFLVLKLTKLCVCGNNVSPWLHHRDTLRFYLQHEQQSKPKPIRFKIYHGI